MVRPVAEAGPAKNGMKPRCVGQPVVDREQVRAEERQAPQAVDDARDGGQQVDEVAERGGQPAGGVVRDDQRDAEGERGGDQQGERAASRVPNSSGHDVGDEVRGAGQVVAVGAEGREALRP